MIYIGGRRIDITITKRFIVLRASIESSLIIFHRNFHLPNTSCIHILIHAFGYRLNEFFFCLFEMFKIRLNMNVPYPRCGYTYIRHWMKSTTINLNYIVSESVSNYCIYSRQIKSNLLIFLMHGQKNARWSDEKKSSNSIQKIAKYRL